MAMRSVGSRGCAACRSAVLSALLSVHSIPPPYRAITAARPQLRSLHGTRTRLDVPKPPAPDAEPGIDVDEAEIARAVHEAEEAETFADAEIQAEIEAEAAAEAELEAELSAEVDAEESARDVAIESGLASDGEARPEEGAEAPWYMQEEAPRHPTLVRETPPLPDLPADPPRILEPLVKYVAEEMGLDDLKLMDLRGLDPPSGFGPKLIMLFGTARSERHLHVSSGRLVSWLRNRGIRADADGLLGPNELKIKLRRKAKKARLLGNTGQVMGEDDGISTRWICVNLGVLELDSREIQIKGPDGNVTGFGRANTGTTVVVQNFTESRRREMDLETLWSRLLARSEKRKLEDALPDNADEPVQPRAFESLLHSPSTAARYPHVQQRAYSTFVSGQRQPARAPRTRHQAVRPLHTQQVSTDIADNALAQAIAMRVDFLSQSLDEVASLGTAQASLALRPAADGKLPSEFMREWHAAICRLPAAQSWPLRLRLMSQRIRHGIWPELAEVRHLMVEMQLLSVLPERQAYFDLLRAAYASVDSHNADAVERQSSKLALEILDMMYLRGIQVLDNDVLVTLMESIAYSHAQEAQYAQMVDTLDHLVTQLDQGYMGEALLARLLNAYAHRDDWDRFWLAWRIPPRHQQPRSSKLYALAYQLNGNTKHQSRCIDAVRNLYQPMLNEQPPVEPKGEVLEHMLRCMKIADPDAETLAKERVVRKAGRNVPQPANREFVRLYKRLMRQRAVNIDLGDFVKQTPTHNAQTDGGY